MFKISKNHSGRETWVELFSRSNIKGQGHKNILLKELNEFKPKRNKISYPAHNVKDLYILVCPSICLFLTSGSVLHTVN